MIASQRRACPHSSWYRSNLTSQSISDGRGLSQASVGITVWSTRRRIINPFIGVTRDAQSDALQ